MRFKDKTVVVTGAAGGIGAAICQRFASEGAHVVVTDVNAEGAQATAAAIRATGGRARAFASDIGTAEGCHAIIADVMATEARIDVLCVDKTGTLTENKMFVRELISDEPFEAMAAMILATERSEAEMPMRRASAGVISTGLFTSATCRAIARRYRCAALRA